MTTTMKRGAIEVVEVEGPAFLASALVNGDLSGLSDQDEYLLDDFHTFLGNARVVSTKDGEEPSFATIRFAGRRFAGEVITYICHQ